MPHPLHIVAIALAKKVLHRVGSDTAGPILWRQRLTRQALMPCIAQRPPVRIGLDAWGGAHSWARRCREPGHEVKRIAPQCVTPFGKSHKNDRRAAEAIAAAVTRPTMRCVPAKASDPHDSQALHRGRERRIGERPARVKAVHGRMHADGMVIAQGGSTCRHAVVETLESDQAKRTPLRQERFRQLVEECAAWEEQLADDQEQLETLATMPPEGPRFMTIPGIGPIPAPALLAAGGDGGVCKHGRPCAAW